MAIHAPSNSEFLHATGQYTNPIAIPNSGTYVPILDRYEPGPSGILIPPSARSAPVPHPPPVPKALDLFCGAGGFSLGMTQGGFHVVAACDAAYDCMRTYLWNLGSPETRIWPMEDAARDELDRRIVRGFEPRKGSNDDDAGPIVRMEDGSYRMPKAGSTGAGKPWPACEHFYLGDVRRLTGERVLRDLGIPAGELGGVFGGPPCQGFSRAGRRDVMDPRNSLVFEFARLVVEIQPIFMVMENVPAIASMVTPEGVNVIDALAAALAKGGWSSFKAVQRSLRDMAGVKAAARGVSGGKDRDAPAGGDGDDDEQDARQLGLFGVAAS